MKTNLSTRCLVACLISHLLLLYCFADAQSKTSIKEIELSKGLVITTSVRIKPKTYRLPAPASFDSAVIIIRGNNITVDFAGATMQGIDVNANPDLAEGIAIRIDSGTNVRILHANVRGYKIGIMANNTQNLSLIGNDVSYNWKPRLFSGIEHESLLDWLSFHHNEKKEWLRYGAGIYLASVTGGEIRDNRSVQGMNALMMTRCDHVQITNNNFSFNSGLGIGLYRSSHNTIVHNQLDYNVRGYSHRFYHRGQDSAGLLFFEQSSENVVAYNSATHGGDGFFLWAGQTTMDSGSGGANDNLLYKNDFSYSPANGIEATFSRNTFIGNLMQGCDYGVWGGYSYESKIIGNTFIRNRVGVAIEHGQNNVISSNKFDGDTTALSFWATSIEPSDWGYPKYRDTKSHDYRIENNLFSSNRYGVKATNTVSLLLGNNRWSNVDTMTKLLDTLNFRSEGNVVMHTGEQFHPTMPDEYAKLAPQTKKGEDIFPKTPWSQMDRSAIIVDEWGPYDWQSPKLWPLDSSHTLPMRLKTLGPKGTWRFISKRGIEQLSKSAGNIGDTISVTPTMDSVGNWELVLEYKGVSVVSPGGERYKANTPYQFSFSRFETATDWAIRFFAWNDSTDPRTKNDAFNALLRSAPIVSKHVAQLDYEWYRPTIKELPQERFAFEANSNVALSPGTYTLRTISDDGVRVWIDDSLVIDNWNQHGSMLDYATLTGGTHRLRVQFFQVDGWVEFRLDVLQGLQRSLGSPQ